MAAKNQQDEEEEEEEAVMVEQGAKQYGPQTIKWRTLNETCNEQTEWHI